MVYEYDQHTVTTAKVKPNEFFAVSKNAPDALKAIINEMQKQFIENDVQDFLNWHGQPMWSKIIKFEKDKYGAVTYAIPTQKNGAITGFFAATINKVNKIWFEMHRETAIISKKGEYSYANISAKQSKTLLDYFNGKSENVYASAASENTSSTWSCYWQWVEVTTLQETSGNQQNMEDPGGYWELRCIYQGGGGGGTGGGDPGGGGTGGGGTGGGCGGGGNTETFNYNWWNNEASLLSPCELIAVINRLSPILNLTALQIHYLMARPARTEEIDRYLTNNPQNTQIAKDHLNKLTQDIAYDNFVENHAQTGDPLKMWWEDDSWLGDPNNFNLDITRSPTELAELNAAEKTLVGLFPIQAYVISTNKQPAFDQSDIVYGVNTIGLNTKKDAFRHAFFNAINTRDVPPQVFPIYLPGSTVVRLFAEAHETTTPAALNLEKQMDLFNNEVGINYCSNCYTNSNTSISNAILAKAQAGELRYLKPIDFTGYSTPGSPFWDNPNTTLPNDGHHGINQNPNQPTVLTPTN